VFAGAVVVTVLIASRDQLAGLIAIIAMLTLIAVGLLVLIPAAAVLTVLLVLWFARYMDCDRLGRAR
jgi:hypothetical protein